MQLQKRKKTNILKIPALVLIATVLLGLLILFGLFHIRQVDVIGNEFYSAQEIQKMVMSDSMAENSLYLVWKYSNAQTAESLPFLNSVEIKMVSPYHVQIQVYEKNIVGYLMFSGSRVYFDEDGNVVEISGEEREGVPPFSGVSISQPAVGEQLPVSEEGFFGTVVEAAQLIDQSSLEPDEVHFDEKQELILYFGTRRVLLGSESYLEEKLLELAAIYPKMEGLSGTLHLETYAPDTTTFRFQKGEQGEEGEDLIIDRSTTPAETPEGEEGAEGEGESGGSAGGVDGSGYVEDDSRITTDADGNEVYTDDLGNVTSNMDQPYLGEDGKVISDGYGYIDPYTGAYILN